jgi:hypothetical protein
VTKDLQFTWMVGNVRVTHAGFGVYTVRGRSTSPADLVSGPHESAHEAVERAERLGEGYAAFRMVRSGSADVEARELLSRDNLPVNLV